MIKKNNIVVPQLCAVVFYIVLTMLFYVLNFSTPMYSDDWLYQYHWGNNTLIKSIFDVISSQYYHYLHINGRVIPHLILQIFDSIIGKNYFNIFNAILFSLLILLLNQICIKEEKYTYKHIYMSFIAIITICLLFPGFKMCFLWMTGSCNYLLTSVLLLLFHNILQSNYTHKTFYPLLFIYGVICGLTHEGLVLGLFVGYIIYFYRNKQEITTNKIILLSGLFIGIGLLLFSPGSLHRAESTSNIMELSIGSVIKSYIIAFIAFKNLRITFLLILLLVILYCKNKIKLNKLLKENIIFIVALIITFLFVWFTKFDSLRSRFGIEFYALIILLRSIVYLNLYKKLGVLSCLISIYILPTALFYSIYNYQITQDYIKQIKNKNIIIFSRSKQETSYVYQRFILKFALPDNIQYYWNFSKKSLENILISRAYKKENIVFLPLEFIEKVKMNPTSLKDFDYKTNFPFYVKEIGNNQEIQEIRLNYNSNYKSLYEKLKYAKMPKSSITDQYETITLNNKTYLLIKRDEYSDKFLERIEIQYKNVQEKETKFL